MRIDSSYVARLCAIASVLLLFPLSSGAQRMIEGQRRFAVSGVFFEAAGISFSYSPRVRYLLSPFYGLEYRRVGEESLKYFSAGEGRDTLAGRYLTRSREISAHLGWSLPLYRTSTRLFVLSADPRIEAGARLHDRRDPLRSVPKAKFVYGAGVRLKAEFFVARNFSAYAFYGPRLQCYGHLRWEESFFQDAGLGVSFYVFPD